MHKELLAAECDKDANDEIGRTPFLIACHEGHLEIVKVLLAVGCDRETKINDRDQINCGATPLLNGLQKGPF